MGRHGVTPEAAKEIVRTRPSVIGAIMLDRGEADALIAGPTGSFEGHLRQVQELLGLRPEAHAASTLHLLVLERGPLFMADTYVSLELPAEGIAEVTLLAAESVRRFGITPKVALLSHSNFGSLDSESARKMRLALTLIRDRAPELEVDGEMHADAALQAAVRARILPASTLTGEANLLIFPNLDAANIAFNLVKAVTNSVTVGPILIGLAKPAHIVTPSVTARGIVNLSALAAVDAQARETVSAS
jgi:malate dehydrogenase (oxaloacetate-decarboxylating)(NADP+)